jgi:hypothetical protein
LEQDRRHEEEKENAAEESNLDLGILSSIRINPELDRIRPAGEAWSEVRYSLQPDRENNKAQSNRQYKSHAWSGSAMWFRQTHIERFFPSYTTLGVI